MSIRLINVCPRHYIQIQNHFNNYQIKGKLLWVTAGTEKRRYHEVSKSKCWKCGNK